MKRPRVICHMMATVDGRIQTERWDLPPAAERQYEAVHALHRADAWMCGRQTFQGDFLEQKQDARFGRRAKVPPGDFIGTYPPRRGRPVYAIAVDAHGKLRWESNEMRGDRFIVLTSQAAPSGYLAHLRSRQISYLIGGKDRIDFAAVLVRLARFFGIRKLMLEGGGSINGALLAAGLVDELSLLLCPFADGSRAEPTLFDVEPALLKKKGSALRLKSVHRRPGDVLWLRYDVR